MLKPCWTYDQVLDALGGPAGVAKVTHQTSGSVCNWRRRQGKFPCKHYPKMKIALEERGYFAPIALWSFAGARAPEHQPETGSQAA